MKLSIYEYRVILINAFVEQAMQSEQGIEDLNRFQVLNEDPVEFDMSKLGAIPLTH